MHTLVTQINGHANPRSVSGASLAQITRHMSPAQRALIGAEIIDGKLIVQGLTAKSIATLVGCSGSLLFAASKLSPDARAAVQRGERPLVEPKTPVMVIPLDWARIDDSTLVDAVRSVGIDRVVNAAIAAERSLHPATF